MNEKEFVLWLKGVVDGIESKGPSKKQWDKIRHKLALVFNKVTPYHPTDINLKYNPKKNVEMEIACGKPRFSDRKICNSMNERRACSSAIEVNVPYSC